MISFVYTIFDICKYSNNSKFWYDVVTMKCVISGNPRTVLINAIIYVIYNLTYEENIDNRDPDHPFAVWSEKILGWTSLVVGIVYIGFLSPHIVCYGLLCCIIFALPLYFMFRWENGWKNHKIFMFICLQLIVSAFVFFFTCSIIASVHFKYGTSQYGYSEAVDEVFNERSTKDYFNKEVTNFFQVLQFLGGLF